MKGSCLLKPISIEAANYLLRIAYACASKTCGRYWVAVSGYVFS